MPPGVRLSEWLAGSARSERKNVSKGLPAPLTSRSGKSAMWAEIKAMQDEIDSQQRMIVALNSSNDALAADLQAWTERCRDAEWRLRLIRMAADGATAG